MNLDQRRSVMCVLLVEAVLFCRAAQESAKFRFGSQLACLKTLIYR